MSVAKFAICANIAAAAFTTTAATAATTTHSSAYGIKADVTVLKGVGTAVAAIGTASGAAPAAYDRTQTVASVTEKARLVDGLTTDAYQSIRTGLITNRAASTWPTALFAEASSKVDALDIDFTTQLLKNLPLLSFGLDAKTLTSRTSVGIGKDGALVSSGSSTIEGLAVGGSLLGALKVDGAGYAAADPNTTIALTGITIILNEQKEVRTGVSDIFRYTNAINIALNKYELLGSIVTGNIIIGHSEAGIAGYVPPVPPVAAVPEPATWGMMILGFGLVGAAARRGKGRMVTA